MTEKILTAALLFMAVGSVKAQNSNVVNNSQNAYTEERTVTVEKSSDKYKVETNRFKSNWFISIAGGAQILFGDHDRNLDLKDRFTPNIEFNFGKWFTPGIGVRVGVNGGPLNGASGWTRHSERKSNEKYPGWNENWYNYQGFIVDPYKETVNGKTIQHGKVYGKDVSGAYNVYETKIKYWHAHIDVMFNLSNMLGGYNSKRFYSFVPYTGVGYANTFNNAVNGLKSHEVSANFGILNIFRISNPLSINLDIRAAYVNDRFDQQEGRRWGEGILSGNIGLTYNFTRRDWGRPENRVERITLTTDNSALQNQINSLLEENARLKKELERNSEGKLVISKSVVAAPQLVVFPIDTWILSNDARVNLGFLAEVIKADSSGTKYVVTGYADRGTGSVARNEKLSIERANVVFRCLVNEFGVPAERLTKKHMGGVDDMYYNDPRVSRAAITRAE